MPKLEPSVTGRKDEDTIIKLSSFLKEVVFSRSLKNIAQYLLWTVSHQPLWVPTDDLFIQVISTQRLSNSKILQGRCNDTNFQKFISVNFWDRILKNRDIITLCPSHEKVPVESERVWCTAPVEWVMCCTTLEDEGIRQRGCPKKTWSDCVTDDMES